MTPFALRILIALGAGSGPGSLAFTEFQDYRLAKIAGVIAVLCLIVACVWRIMVSIFSSGKTHGDTDTPSTDE
jgi:uncharacterized membrane protein YqjE